MRATIPLMLGIAMLQAQPALAATLDAETAIARYCEPLLAGAAAASLGAMARRDGFKDEVVAGQQVLLSGRLLLALSDAPRVCLVQAPKEMRFDQGLALVDGWASHHPGAVKSPTMIGPDGARVRAWTAPAQKRTLLVSEQTNALKQKVLAFILMPMPPAPR